MKPKCLKDKTDGGVLLTAAIRDGATQEEADFSSIWHLFAIWILEFDIQSIAKEILARFEHKFAYKLLKVFHARFLEFLLTEKKRKIVDAHSP